MHTEKTPKTAVVVSKKVHKTAVKRNTLRRRLYATLKELHGPSQAHRIVIAKPGVEQKTSHTLLTTLRAILDGSGKHDTMKRY